MPNLKTHWIREEDGEENITILYKGRTYQAHKSHQLWDRILEGAMKDDPAVTDLFDLGLTIGEYLTLGDRVTYQHGQLFLDGDEVHDGLAKLVVQMLQAGEEVGPFVAVIENIAQNPSKHTREQLGNYIERNGVTTTQDGLLVLYKYVNRAGTQDPKASSDPWKNKPYQSGHAGPAVVNGLAWESGYVRQDIGDVVTMPRSKVLDDPSLGCASGLHVGAWAYVSQYGQIKLEVHVHPRDVVSVPRDSFERKMRVCRYVIIGERTEPYTVPVLPPNPVQPVALASEPALPAEKAKIKVPTQRQFDEMVKKAKKAKKGLVAYATKKGWKLITSGGAKNRLDWRLP